MPDQLCTSVPQSGQLKVPGAGVRSAERCHIATYHAPHFWHLNLSANCIRLSPARNDAHARGLLVSVREDVESDESFVIQERLPDSEGSRRCGPPKTGRAMTAVASVTRAISPVRSGR